MAARSLGVPELAGVGSYKEATRIGLSVEENVRRLVPHAEMRPSAWTHEEWDVIGQHDHTFPGIAATNRYSMKATVYAAELLDFISKIEG